MVGPLMLAGGRMRRAIERESFGQTASMVDDMFALAGARAPVPRDGPPPPPPVPSGVSTVARGFINGAMSVRNNYQHIMCASRMMNAREFAPPPPPPGRGHGGPEFGY